MHGIGGDLELVVVEHGGQDLEGETRGDACHALVGARVIAVFLIGLGLGIDVLQALAVVDAHLRVEAGILRLLQPRQHRELRHHLERARGAGRGGEGAPAQQLLVDLDLLGGLQAVGHLHDVDAVEEGLVVLVVAERLPLGLVGVREDDAVEGNGREALGALVVALLRRGQERVQHLDRGLEHLHEFEQPLVGEAQPAGVAVGVRVALRVAVELADIDLAHQRGDVLVVLVSRLGLGDRDLPQDGRLDPHHAEARNVPAVFLQALDRPRRHDAREVARGDAVIGFEHRAVLRRREEAERALVDGRALQRVDRALLHQLLQALRDGGLAPADGTQQVEHLLPLLETLRRVLQERHDLRDHVLQAVELRERGIALDDAVGEETGQARIVPRVDDLGLADRGEHPLRGRCIGARIGLAEGEVVVEGDLLLTRRTVVRPILLKQRLHGRPPLIYRIKVRSR
jgi:hypothetical protein